MGLYTKIIDLQKLIAAWLRARKNKPAAGVDGVTYEQFDANQKEEIKQLQLELQARTYQPLPVREVRLYKGEKVRVIALYAMRDKVVQQSIATELTAMYDGRFSSQTYAYRNNKSAITAVEEIDEKIRSGRYTSFLKVDIKNFFDNIVWQILKQVLAESITEDEVMELIHGNACAPCLDENSGEIEEKRIGIHQGSAIAPILSNIYLMEFDQWLSTGDVYFVRYSDDILILGQDREALVGLLQEIKLRLERLGLRINETKSVVGFPSSSNI